MEITFCLRFHYLGKSTINGYFHWRCEMTGRYVRHLTPWFTAISWKQTTCYDTSWCTPIPLQKIKHTQTIAGDSHILETIEWRCLIWGGWDYLHLDVLDIYLWFTGCTGFPVVDHQAATWLPSLPATNPFLHLHLISADSLQWIGFVGKSTGFSWDLPTQIARCPAIFPYLKAIPCKDSVEWMNRIEQSGWIDLESMKDMPTMPSCFLSPSWSQSPGSCASSEPRTLAVVSFRTSHIDPTLLQGCSQRGASNSELRKAMEESRSEEDSPITKDKTEPRRDDGSPYIIVKHDVTWLRYNIYILYVPWRHVPILVLWEGKNKQWVDTTCWFPTLGFALLKLHLQPHPFLASRTLLRWCFISTVQLFYLLEVALKNIRKASTADVFRHQAWGNCYISWTFDQTQR